MTKNVKEDFSSLPENFVRKSVALFTMWGKSHLNRYDGAPADYNQYCPYLLKFKADHLRFGFHP